ncbi:tRNA (guanine(10)-N2)-methyltransferase [Amphibalanus amphitrite]|uniref:tRNA (guanine(10)-N(2))-methyltransferase TRMT11 n=1 Tax=Amphibalanus amphitrite TaxID=1232801 RepID=A0A6A4VW74_AMPAM|nr:tRNA (guanine(10)-N2)-methyltransferase [Amphibalanus amphitrite]
MAAETRSPAAVGTDSDRTYLLCFSNELTEFREPELRAVLSLLGLTAHWTGSVTATPYLEVRLASEADARRLAQRTVAVKCCLELWAAADSEEELHRQLRQRLLDHPDTMLPHFGPETSFKVNVESFNRTLSHEAKVARVESFDYLPLEGPVRLRHPDLRLDTIEYYGLDPNRVPERPLQLFFGRWLCDGPRAAIKAHSLKTRAYIGNTSMDPELALIMANMARVRSGDTVYDPFVGTGSLLVAAAHFGGHVLGTDIDYLTVHARTRPSRVQERGRRRGAGESIAANLRQYGLQSRLVDVLVADAALPALWRRGVTVDAIITDPPYGIREPTERVGSARPSGGAIPAQHRAAHFPSKVAYGPGALFGDLLRLAADRLTLGGRLVFWLPVTRAQYSADRLPSHPCLRLVANSEQTLTARASRRLLTLEKWREPGDGDAATVHTSVDRFVSDYFSSGFTEEGGNGDPLAAADAELARLEAAGCRAEQLPLYIDALHGYNEIKDAAQLVMGRIAELDGVTVRSVHQRYECLPPAERQ